MSTNLPPAFVDQMQKQLGNEFETFAQALTTETPVSVRINARKEWAENPFLNNEAVKWNHRAYYLKERPVFTLDPAFHAGAYYVQEASSMFLQEAIRQCIDLNQPLKVLDLCAAPGGKTTLMADVLNEQSLLVANEVIKSRVGVLKENLLKWGFQNYIITNHDSEEFADLEGFFDLVLVDAPCSGEGLFRKDPEATSHWSEEAVQTCSARQKRILQAAAMAVAPGGTLIYSTCTYNDFENIGNVKWFIKDQEFKETKLDISAFPGVSAKDFGYQFYPHKIKGEGFFIAVLKKSGGTEDFVHSRIKLNHATRKQTEVLAQWVKNIAKFEFFIKPDGMVVAVPVNLVKEYASVLKALFKRSSGFEIGEFKNNNFVPSHALALSTEVNADIPTIELSKENALLFLKRETFDLDADQNGWHLVTYQGLGLGWIKVIGDRINNYLPKEWRIRMDIPS